MFLVFQEIEPIVLINVFLYKKRSVVHFTIESVSAVRHVLAVNTFCAGGDGDDGEIFHGLSVDRHDDAGQDFAAKV